MRIQVENLKAQMQGINLNIYEKADALIEFHIYLVFSHDQLVIRRLGTPLQIKASFFI